MSETTRNLLIAVVQSRMPKQPRKGCKSWNDGPALASIGGFLGRRNATLMIGLPENMRAKAEEILRQNCRQRVEFIAVAAGKRAAPAAHPHPITVGGATVFALKSTTTRRSSHETYHCNSARH